MCSSPVLFDFCLYYERYYCGGDKVNGDKSTLYLCKSSKPAGAKYCANGCHTATSGSDDYCN